MKNKTREDIIKILNGEAEKINNSLNEIPPEWNIDEFKLINGEIEFKLVHSVGSWSCYYYFVSNIGRVIVVKTNEASDEIKMGEKKTIKFDDSEKINKSNCWFIPIENGYLSKSVLEESPDQIKLTTTTDIYKFMIEAGWLDYGDDYVDNKNCKELASKIVDNNIKNGESDRLEVHHIDNNPSNNNIKNLIWVPQSIHKLLH